MPPEKLVRILVEALAGIGMRTKSSISHGVSRVGFVLRDLP
jgi:hypothetical protein